MSCKRSNGSPPTFNPPNKVVRTEESCIFCHKDCDEKQKEVSVEKWKEFHSLAKQWCGLDKFGDVLTTVDWVSGHRGKYWHKSCQLIFTGSRKLKQAIARKNSEKENVPKEESLTATNNQDERPATRGKTGTIHNPDVCIWCTKSIFGKNSERYGPSRQLIHQRTWSRIGASIAYIEDAALRPHFPMNFYIAQWQSTGHVVQDPGSIPGKSARKNNLDIVKINVNFLQFMYIYENKPQKSLPGTRLRVSRDFPLLICKNLFLVKLSFTVSSENLAKIEKKRKSNFRNSTKITYLLREQCKNYYEKFSKFKDEWSERSFPFGEGRKR